ncbi:MAG: M81 family metallopeptidase [Bacteroidota bacterium]
MLQTFLRLSPIISLFLLFGCSPKEKPLPRIAIAGIAIESSTFSPAKTEEQAFHPRYKDGIYFEYPFLSETADLRQRAEWFPTVRGHALPGGIVTREAYESLLGKTLKLLEENLPYDGLFLDIHGAMSVEGIDDPEGDFIIRVREVVGNETIISTSMDLHGNVSGRLAENTDLITCYRMAPHEDAMDSKKRAATNLVERLESGKGKPKFKARIKVPILLPGEKTSTRVEPGKSLYAKVQPLTEDGGVIDAAIWMGYPWADEPRNHGVVMAVGDDQQKVAAAAEQLASAFWTARDKFEFVAPTTTLEESIQAAISSEERPFFISDMGDNPTAGGAGDVTWTLTEILNHEDLAADQSLQIIYASIPGPELIEQALAVGEGGTVSANVGADVDDRYSPPIKLSGTVEAIKTGDKNAEVEAVVKVDNTYVIVTKKRKPYHYEKDFAELGLEIKKADIVFVKIGYLVPELFNLQKGWLMALTPGGVDQDLERLDYKRIQRPMFPIDEFSEEPNLQAQFIPVLE